MKYTELIKLIENDGWFIARQKGSHKQYKHPVKKGLVTIAHHGKSNDVGPKMLKSVLQQAQIDQ